MLRWAAENTTQISIDHGVGPVEVRGNREVSPISSTTYILSARGAGGTDSRSVTVEVATPVLPPPAGASESRTSRPDVLASEVEDVYFDYDSTEIGEDARQTLRRDAVVLKRIFAGDPSFMVIIEGHCDERGSSEYNLGLGDRRATSVEDFFAGLGVPADRLRTISYGKERPVCTDANEACYQRNRRAHLAPAR
jgi:peptidoglycan-associated lipoprotein